MNMVVKLVPKVATNWEIIGYCLGLEDEDMDTIEESVSRTSDMKSACTKVIKAWIKSTHGREPKTWRTFMTALQELDIDCDPVLEVLQKELV